MSLTCGTSYTFNVRAYGDGTTFEDDWGPIASISATTDLCLPPEPANLEVTSTSRTSIGLDWDSRNGISNYRVSYGSNSPETTSSAYTATGLTCGTSYTFNVSAYGNGSTYRAVWGSSASIPATTDLCLPPAPANLEVTSASRTSIGLDWDFRSGISNYRVRYGSNSPETTSSAYTATRLTCGTTYTFNVSAYGDGTTYRAAWGPSASISATTDLCLPPAPANLEVTSASRTSIGLDWDSRNGISKYRVSYGSTTKETTSSAYTVTGLTRGTSYTFNVSAYGDDATYRAAWGPSASISATTDAPNRCPVFTDGTTAARRVDEDTGSNTNIGSPVSATDLDGDRLTYGKSGGDAASFTLGSSTGQLGASAALDYETKSIYEFSMTVSDGTCTDTIEVTVIVGDVDEPPSTPGAPTVTATSGSTTSLDVSWTAPANAGKPPITGYDLQYRQGTTGSFQAGPQNVAGASATISRLQMNALYEVQVRATNAEGDGPYSSSGSGRTNALPTVTIARHSSTAATVTEGQLVRFILTASIAPAAALTVNVSVTDTGSFLTGTVPSQVTIRGRNTTAGLALRTDDDSTTEANGTTTVTVLPGTGYIVGSPSSASVTIEDDDPWLAGLRANGHLVDGKVTLRWNKVDGATSYEVRYAEEVCVPETAATTRCGPGDPPGWNTITITPDDFATTAREITIDGVVVVEASLEFEKPNPLRNDGRYNTLSYSEDPLAYPVAWPLYRVEVRAVAVGSSDWSQFALVFPTSDTDTPSAPVVATNPIDDHLEERNGSHEYRYTICTGTITADVAWGRGNDEDATAAAIAADIEAAIEAWETTVRWVTDGVNIIAATATISETCPEDGAVAFLSRERIEDKCGGRNIMGCNPFGTFSIYLRTTPLDAQFQPTRWDVMANGCSLLHKLTMHEAGHVFGMTHPTTRQAVMHGGIYEWLMPFCRPQPYDVVGIMANYQWR